MAAEAKQADVEQEAAPTGLLDVLHIVAAHNADEGNAAVGICRGAWSDTRTWLAIIDMQHSPKNTNGEIDFTASRLGIASLKGELDVVQRMLDLGADIEARNAKGHTALFAACRHGHVHVANFLLDRHANIEARNIQDATPLFIAATMNQVAIIELLCNRHADINVLNNDNTSALFIACHFANIEATRVLLARGANVDLGDPPILEACILPHEDDQAEMDMSTLWARRLQVVRILADHNANLNVVNANGWTALMFAIRYNQAAIVELLLDRHVDLNVVNANGWTALMFAIRYNQAAIV